MNIKRSNGLWVCQTCKRQAHKVKGIHHASACPSRPGPRPMPKSPDMPNEEYVHSLDQAHRWFDTYGEDFKRCGRRVKVIAVGFDGRLKHVWNRFEADEFFGEEPARIKEAEWRTYLVEIQGKS